MDLFIRGPSGLIRLEGTCLRPGAKPGMRFAAQAQDRRAGFMTTRWNPNHFAVRASEALRGELRGRTRLSGRSLAPPSRER